MRPFLRSPCRLARRLSVTTACALLLFAAGCKHNVYEIDLTPSGGELHRELTCWRTSGNEVEAMPPDELQRIASQYGTKLEIAKDHKQKFQGKFGDKLPGDVGGAGYYSRVESPLGDAYTYQERFRGDVQLAAVLERRREATNELVNHLIGWLQSELSAEPKFADLRSFLDTEFRQDLQNISLLMWTDSTSESLAEIQVVQYLVERGYGSQREIAGVLSEINNGGQLTTSLVQRFIARKLGLPDDGDLPPSLEFLRTDDAMQASLNKYLRGTPAFEKKHAEWEKSRVAKPDEPEPTPDEIAGDLVGRAFFFGAVFQAADRLTLALQLVDKPYKTNGAWSDKTRRVSWNNLAIYGADGPAAFVYAWWSEPNRDKQRDIFGQVVLRDAGLAAYVHWYARLSDQQRGEWDRFLGTLKPGFGLPERIGSFRFSTDEPATDPAQPPASAADVVRDLILKTLAPNR